MASRDNVIGPERRPSRRQWLADHRKYALGLSLQAASARLGVDEATLVRWENGQTRHIAPHYLPILANVYGLSARRVMALEQARLGSYLDAPTATASLARLAAAVHALATGEPPAPLATPGPTVVDEWTVSNLELEVKLLRQLEDMLGGDEVLPLVWGRLVPLTGLVDLPAPVELAQRLWVTAGQLCRLAGSAAFDAGYYTTARACLETALRAADGCGDRELAALVLADSAWQASLLREYADGIRYAQTALRRLAIGEAPRTRALVLVCEAACRAGSGDRQGAERCLSHAGDLLAGTGGPLAERSGDVGQARIDHYTGLCMLALGDNERARKALALACDRYDPALVRQRALAACALAVASCGADDALIEEAVTAAHHALDLACQLGSGQLDRALNKVTDRLRVGKEARPAAAALVDRYDAWARAAD